MPNHNNASFVELYNEGIIDFKPLGNTVTVDKNNIKKATPSLKTEPSAYVYFIYTGSYPGFIKKPCEKGINGCLYNNGSAYSGQIKEVLVLYYPNNTTIKGFDPKFLKTVDEKMDDGWYSTGILRGNCYGSGGAGYNSYENAIVNGKKCSTFSYSI